MGFAIIGFVKPIPIRMEARARLATCRHSLSCSTFSELSSRSPVPTANCGQPFLQLARPCVRRRLTDHSKTDSTDPANRQSYSGMSIGTEDLGGTLPLRKCQDADGWPEVKIRFRTGRAMCNLRRAIGEGNGDWGSIKRLFSTKSIVCHDDHTLGPCTRSHSFTTSVGTDRRPRESRSPIHGKRCVA